MCRKKSKLNALALLLVSSATSVIHAAEIDLSNAEVIVTSSTNAAYVGMTNTNAQGKFALNGVPAGGIHVEIRRNGETIAQGGAVTAGGNLSEAQVVGIVVVPASSSIKSK